MKYQSEPEQLQLANNVFNKLNEKPVYNSLVSYVVHSHKMRPIHFFKAVLDFGLNSLTELIEKCKPDLKAQYMNVKRPEN